MATFVLACPAENGMSPASSLLEIAQRYTPIDSYKKTDTYAAVLMQWDYMATQFSTKQSSLSPPPTPRLPHKKREDDWEVSIPLIFYKVCYEFRSTL